MAVFTFNQHAWHGNERQTLQRAKEHNTQLLQLQGKRNKTYVSKELSLALIVTSVVGDRICLLSIIPLIC